VLQRKDKVRIGGESLHVDMLTTKAGRGFVSLVCGVSDSVTGGGKLRGHAVLIRTVDSRE
jgi:hypothetical protein